MPMTQDDIRAHDQTEWKPSDDPGQQEPKRYRSAVEDAVVYPIDEALIRDHRIAVDGGRVLDVGCGSGRWLRFFRERFTPRELVGIDFTSSSIELLRRWRDTLGDTAPTAIDLAEHELTDPVTPAPGRFDLINVADVLFHIPENDKCERALANLGQLEAADGRIVTTEYLPRIADAHRMDARAEPLRVRGDLPGRRPADRGLRSGSSFASHPMGLEGPDATTRGRFFEVRKGMQVPLGTDTPELTAFGTRFLIDIEEAMVAYRRERIGTVDLPSQKLVVLAPA